MGDVLCVYCVLHLPLVTHIHCTYYVTLCSSNTLTCLVTCGLLPKCSLVGSVWQTSADWHFLCCRNVYGVWRAYLEGTVEVNQTRLYICENYKNEISDPAKTVRLYKEQQLKKVLLSLTLISLTMMFVFVCGFQCLFIFDIILRRDFFSNININKKMPLYHIMSCLTCGINCHIVS